MNSTCTKYSVSRTSWTANFDSELSRASACSFNDELSLEGRQKTVLNALSVDVHFASVRDARYQQDKRTSYVHRPALAQWGASCLILCTALAANRSAADDNSLIGCTSQ